MEILIFLNKLFGFLFYVFFIILFFLSLKKCFYREGYGKVKLFCLSLLTNPFFVFFVLTLISTIIVFIWQALKSDLGIMALGNREYGEFLATDQYFSSLIILITTLLFFALIIPISFLMGKSLKAYNKSMVMFVYIMFSVLITSVHTRGSNIPKDAGWIIQISYDINNIAWVIAALLLYFFIAKALSGLADRKRHVNWKLFLITPTLFIIGYNVLDYYTYLFCSDDANTIVQILSYVIWLLFIWAFYIIINNIKATDDAIKAKDEVKTLSVEVMEALAHTIDAKDEYTRGHSVRVAKYSKMIAEKMGLNAEDCENVYYMGLLHDLGKIGVPNEIINSSTKLTDEEYTIVKKHPGFGFDILSEIKSKPDLVIGARWHHERYDGRGSARRYAFEYCRGK